MVDIKFLDSPTLAVTLKDKPEQVFTLSDSDNYAYALLPYDKVVCIYSDTVNFKAMEPFALRRYILAALDQSQKK